MEQQVKPGVAYRFRRRGETLTLEYDSITTGEWIALERATGLSWMDLTLLADRRAARGMVAFYWLARRRYEDTRLIYTDPAMDFPLRELQFELVLAGDADEAAGEQQERPDPTEPATSPSPAS